jgi:hypothetical protein
VIHGSSRFSKTQQAVVEWFQMSRINQGNSKKPVESQDELQENKVDLPPEWADRYNTELRGQTMANPSTNLAAAWIGFEHRVTELSL